jgi:hypothetical protein
MFMALALWGIYSPAVQASSVGTVQIAPNWGPVGTPVHVEVRLFPAAPLQYILRAATHAPDPAACVKAPAIRGIAAVTVSSHGGSINFRWPRQLNKGPYWLCATPREGDGAIAFSPYPFTVGTTPPVAPFSPAAVVDLTSLSTPAGSALDVYVTQWITTGDTPPEHVQLLSDAVRSSPPSVGTDGDIPFTAITDVEKASGTFTLHVTVPRSTPDGDYYLLVSGQPGSAATQTFHVAALAASPSSAHLSSPGSPTTSSAQALFVTAGVALLLLFAAGSLIAAALRPRRQ